jgi:septum formation protein
MASTARLILASRSPARLHTLRAAGIEPEVMVSDVDEEALEAAAPEASPEQLALLLARAKAEMVAATVDGPAIVLGCDSVFELDGTAFGKPQSPDVARQRWRQMMGRAGTLHTGHHVIETSTGRSTSEVASTVVHMGTMSDEEMDDYLATGEPLHVAGGFTLDGLGGAFVEAVEGDPSNVVGISLPTVRRLLSELGVRWTSLWSEGLIDHSDPR